MFCKTLHTGLLLWLFLVVFFEYSHCHIKMMEQLPNDHQNSGPQCNIENPNARFNCDPSHGATEKSCSSRNCCWQPADKKSPTEMVGTDVPKNLSTSVSSNMGVGVPSCYFPTDYEGYVITQLQETDYGFSVSLERRTVSGWPMDVAKLQLDVWIETETRLHFKITDPSERRYEVPISRPRFTMKGTDHDFKVSFQKAPFAIKVTRKSTGAVLFDSTVAPLIYADQFLQMSTHTGTGLVYGLGEHTAPLLFNGSWTRLVMWNLDGTPTFNRNGMGTHPFYLNLESDGKSHGVLLLNSNAMEVDLQPLPALTFRTIGGILDFYIFAGPSSDSVVQQYTYLVGTSYMPPIWSLGFHLSRYGYHNGAEVKKIIARTRALGIPYDVQWTDIDIMDGARDWTYDKKRFSDLPEIVQDLHNHSQRYVIIADPAISNKSPGKYPPYDEGIRDHVFIISNQTKQPLVATLWSGTVVIPDHTHPNTTDWWYRQAKAFHDAIPYDGVWLDVSEPLSIVAGSTTGCSKNQFDRPPYVPSVFGKYGLSTMTVCPSAQLYESSHYNLHNFYGTAQAKDTYLAMKKIRGKRSFVTVRCPFPSAGQWGGHWTGDVLSKWQHLYYTIPGLLRTNMFGISQAGSDICGFDGDTTEELCTRWMQLGAFYPYSRNQNSKGMKEQDPGAWSPRAQQIMKRAFETRYMLIPYLYTLYFHSHTQGTTVMRPLFFNFPLDRQTYGIDRQFMWGSSLLISPVLDKGKSTVNAYFPRARWYDLLRGVEVKGQGQWLTLNAPLEVINSHVRGGSILPIQTPNVTTSLMRISPFHLLVALSENDTASGDLYWDDGESLDSLESGVYNLIQFSASKGCVESSIAANGYFSKMVLGSIAVFGLNSPPRNITVNGKQTQFSYSNHILNITTAHLNIDLRFRFVAQWK